MTTRELKNRSRSTASSDSGLANRGDTNTPLNPSLFWEYRRIAPKTQRLLRSTDENEKSPSFCVCGTAGFGVQYVPLIKTTTSKGEVLVKTKKTFRCKSGWSCPTCSISKAATNAEKTADVFWATKAHGENSQVLMVTLTCSHTRDTPLIDSKAAITKAKQSAMRGSPWDRKKEQYDIAGCMTAPEWTWSAQHGHHFHFHVAIVLLKASQDDANDFGGWFIDRYIEAVRRQGARAEYVGQSYNVVRSEDATTYLSKGSVSKSAPSAWELSAGALKNTKRNDGFTIWEIALHAADNSDPMAMAIFAEYSKVMAGTRSCLISSKLKERLGLDEEPDSNADDHRSDFEGHEEILGEIARDELHRLQLRGHLPALFEAAESGLEWPELRQKIAVWSATNQPKKTKDEHISAEDVALRARSYTESSSSASKFISKATEELSQLIRRRQRNPIAPSVQEVISILSEMR